MDPREREYILAIITLSVMLGAFVVIAALLDYERDATERVALFWRRSYHDALDREQRTEPHRESQHTSETPQVGESSEQRTEASASQGNE